MSKPSQRLEEYADILKRLIQDNEEALREEETGKVLSNQDGILILSGLSGCSLNEVVQIGDERIEALILVLRENSVGAVALGNYYKIAEGMTVVKTGKQFSAPFGDALLGRIVNIFGAPIDGGGAIVVEGWAKVEDAAPEVMERSSVCEPLYTGILAIDAMIPIGKGQRELIIGDRQTGKTSLAIEAIVNQKGRDVYCVFVSIGQKNSNVFQIAREIERVGALNYTTMVVASASDFPALQFLAPFVGITIAEYWMRKGKNVLIVYDDLTQHAIAYRTLSLLLNFPPGREAFPGDIFYLHSRLLERAGKLSSENGGGSITALPIIQTQSDDIAAYIPSNVISITDGQLFLKTNLFNSGQRPAIDLSNSVSRVGGAAQESAIKSMTSDLKLFVSQYFELLEFSKFSSDLNEESKKVLAIGDRILPILRQAPLNPYSPQDEVLLLHFISAKLILEIERAESVSVVCRRALELWRTHRLYKSLPLGEKIGIETKAELTQLFKSANRDVSYSSGRELNI
ncbi:F0F1 ATP synthase subunit alpha [Candidatus Mycoplasma haematominutum]|uniref:ATP synthase subunit alpha n=1 Tax=Candidatus Mycoplasma haematominutum 'Birmingham 1' TaxID=1116213 RepID=G8C3A2_9MOLU|nr:F0F1 ATP synthase subunit alpha [Candidatus Mycoplasma haematominutum]CCE66800.1 ATP synthase, alpha subunit [Candidatus Mycoplasma haematominutum 'Birmingham 1']